MSIKSSYTLTISLFAITILSGTVLSSTVSATDTNTSQDNVTVSVPVSCTMNGTGMSSHTANIPNGTYQADIGTTTLKTFCNDNQGFAIYAIGYTNEEYGNTTLIGATGGQTIVTGTATTTGSPDVSNWAVKLATDSTATYPITLDNSFGAYSSVPSTYTKVAHRDSGTDLGSSATGASLTTTYAAYISKIQQADTYNGKVKYTLVHPASEEPAQPHTATSGCINYFANTSTAVGTMGCQPISDSDTSATLLASNYSRTGYGFAGWSDSFDYATNPNARFYGPQESISFTAGQYTGSNNGLSLYAVWIKSAGSIQNWNNCANLTTAPTDGTANLSSVTALTDQRDDNTYAVARLADGKCWMIENLRLESTNSDNFSGALAQGYGTSATYGNFGGLADAESTHFSNSATANSLYYSGTQSGTATIDVGVSNYPAYRMPRYNNWNNQITSADRPQNPTTNTATNSTTNAGMYSYGNYYTWHAAVADLTYNGANNQSITGTSLCPAGWHLPTGGMAYASGSTSGVNVTGDTSTFREFYNLGYKIMDEVRTAYEDTPNSGDSYYSRTTNTTGNTATKAFRSYPNNFLYSGLYNDASVFNRGSYGYYWSSAAFDRYGGYRMGLDISNVSPGAYSSYKYYGESIRCVVGS